jgi:signal transduction histidine kinase
LRLLVLLIITVNIFAQELADNTGLTLSQVNYLSNKKELKLCIGPDSMPFEDFNKNGEYIGLTSDYYKIFSKNLNIPITVVPVKTWKESVDLSKNRTCDIISAMQTEERKEYLNFTSPYLKTPVVIATKNYARFISDFKDLTDQKIGVPKSYAYVEELKKIYPNINYVEVPTIKDGLKKVIDGELYGQVGTLASIGYFFITDFAGSLKIAGKTDKVNLELGIGVRNDDPILFGILQNQVENIDESFHNKILNNWINIKYDTSIDYSLVYKIFALIFVFIIFIVYKQYYLKRMNKKLEEEVDKKTKLLVDSNNKLKNNELILKEYTQDLEIKIKEEVDKNIKIQKQLFTAEKISSMIEMINNISHQWRQPLSIISTVATGMLLKKEYGLLEDKEFRQNCFMIDSNVQFISKTIDNFRNFIDNESSKKVFDLENTIDNFLNLVGALVINDHINIILNLEKDIKINGYENELIQCFINIFNNTRTALNEKKIENKLIFISTSILDNKVIITIKDNAQGISEKVINKLFEPYVTSKYQSQGIGLGLYITYSLIVERMSGTIDISNTISTYNNRKYSGADVTITLPLEAESTF